jgi:hypothetical protein
VQATGIKRPVEIAVFNQNHSHPVVLFYIIFNENVSFNELVMAVNQILSSSNSQQ